MHLAGIRLLNYCGYKDCKFNFLNIDDKPSKIIVVYGPNGFGKTSLLEAIKLVSNPFLYEGRDCRLFFRKLTYNTDYDPVYGLVKDAKQYISKEDFENEKYNDFEKNHEDNLKEYEVLYEDLVSNNDNNMEIEGAFDNDDNFNTVLINSYGLLKNEMEKRQNGYALSLDADNPNNLNKFQVSNENADTFLKIAHAVYGFPCKFNESVEEQLKDKDGNIKIIEIYTDFMINKNGVTVHYKRMSAGEKKIATLLSCICEPNYIKNADIIIIDNFDMHVYWKRHAVFLDKLLENFPEKQFIITTHSETLINHVGKKYGTKCLFDLEEIKKG